MCVCIPWQPARKPHIYIYVCLHVCVYGCVYVYLGSQCTRPIYVTHIQDALWLGWQNKYITQIRYTHIYTPNLYIYIHIYIYTHTCTYLPWQLYECMCVWVNTLTYTYIHTSAQKMWVYTLTYTYIHTDVCVCVCVSVWVCGCVYVYLGSQRTRIVPSCNRQQVTRYQRQRLWMSHWDESWHTYGWVMARLRMSRGT